MTTTHEPAVTISDSAVRHIAALREQEKDAGLMLRVAVAGGGCSGFQYEFRLDRACNEDDVVFEREGIKVVVDQASLELVAGSEIDYVEDLIGSSFAVRNPNATSSCGCGVSFSI